MKWIITPNKQLINLKKIVRIEKENVTSYPKDTEYNIRFHIAEDYYFFEKFTTEEERDKAYSELCKKLIGGDK